MQRLTDPVNRRRALEFAADAVLAAAAFALAFTLRFLDDGGNLPERYETMLLGSVAFVALGKALVIELFGLHQQWWRYFRLPDLWPLFRALAVATVLMVLVFVLAKPYDVQPAALGDHPRLHPRLRAARRRPARPPLARRAPDAGAIGAARAREVLVVGAGSGGQMVVRELKLNPNLGARAIGFLDDDPRKRGMRTEGLKVLGTTDEIGAVLDRLTPDEVVIAIPSAPGVLRGKVVAECRERDIQVRTLPTVFELLRGGVQLTRQLREVRVEDVLGRDPVVMELDRVGAYLEDKRVLVTGAGGSIGSELVRQIARVRPRLLVMLDHAEDNLFEIDREMTSHWHFTRVESVLADCKEGDRMLEVMQRFKPEVVFHAAAYKHVPLMEANPLEALRNNAIATQVTAKTAAAAGAERFVLVSTDKAVNPRTVMGATKALAEWIVAAAGARHPQTAFTIVRFGNVLASSGSVVPIFRSQIERGGPVDRHPPGDDALLHDHPGGGAARDPGRRPRRRVGRGVRARDGRAGEDHRPGAEHDPPRGLRAGGRDRDRDHRRAARARSSHEELFNPDESPQPTAADRIVRAVRTSPLDPDWVEETVCEAADPGRLGRRGGPRRARGRAACAARALRVIRSLDRDTAPTPPPPPRPTIWLILPPATYDRPDRSDRALPRHRRLPGPRDPRLPDHPAGARDPPPARVGRARA